MNKLIKKSAATLLLASVAMPAFADNYNVGVSGAWAYLDADGKQTKKNETQMDFGGFSIICSHLLCIFLCNWAWTSILWSFHFGYCNGFIS